MREENKKSIIDSLYRIYKDRIKAEEAFNQMDRRFQRYEEKESFRAWLTEEDVMLITYGDTLQKEGKDGIKTLHKFLKKYVGDAVSSVHLLPMYPYTSDDGFSVVDYRQINPDLGSWEDVNNLAGDYKLMFDGVINHISKSSKWFEKFLACEEPYKNYFIAADPQEDYSQVIRPRALPLLTPFETKEGEKYVWTTFSEDQIDLNYKSIDLLIEMLDILITYALNGAAFALNMKEKETRSVELFGDKGGATVFPLEVFGEDGNRLTNISYPSYETEDLHYKSVANFVRSCLGKDTLIVTSEQAVYVQKLICTLYESAKMEKPVIL